MPFITYAQNFEDVMLHRALRHVSKGLYIDLGAADPDSHSVTRAFYERGWRGINVEPHPGFFSRLIERRPGDVNINAAVSDRAGEQDFYFVGENTGLSTLEAGMAIRHEQLGLPVRVEKIRVTTLREICEAHVGDLQIHFLKLDVEGHELPVLHGHDFSRWRPWIVLAEAHDEHDTWEEWKAWQGILEQADYRFVYQDGLNRFFVAIERHDDLAKAFRAPPNCYDDWQSAEAVSLEQRLSAAENRAAEWEHLIVQKDALIAQLQGQVASAQADLVSARAEADAIRTESAALRASSSWRVTAPLRAIASVFRR